MIAIERVADRIELNHHGRGELRNVRGGEDLPGSLTKVEGLRGGALNVRLIEEIRDQARDRTSVVDAIALRDKLEDPAGRGGARWGARRVGSEEVGGVPGERL